MSLATLLNRQITVQRRSVDDTDQYGNDVQSLAAVEIVGGYIEQTEAVEVVIDRETYVTTHLVMIEAGVNIDGADRVIDDDGIAYEIVGPPHSVRNPRTRRVSHVECRARVAV